MCFKNVFSKGAIAYGNPNGNIVKQGTIQKLLSRARDLCKRKVSSSNKRLCSAGTIKEEEAKSLFKFRARQEQNQESPKRLKPALSHDVICMKNDDKLFLGLPYNFAT